MERLVYCDQNCLIAMGSDPIRYAEKLRLAAERDTRIVLSPWHWVEIARNEDATRLNSLADFADSINPLWLPQRRTVQGLEVEARFREVFGISNGTVAYAEIASMGSRGCPWPTRSRK